MKTNPTLSPEVEKRFDDKFELSFDVGVPTSEEPDAGSEVDFYEKLKSFLAKEINAAVEKARRETLEDCLDVLGTYPEANVVGPRMEIKGLLLTPTPTHTT